MMISAKTTLPYFLGLTLMLVTLSGCGGRIGALMDLGANEQLKRQTVREETKNYKTVKAALQKDAIKKGMTQKEIVRRYGQPVLTYPERDGGKRLVYKATASDWLKGEKIYLFLDARDTFTNAECIHCP